MHPIVSASVSSGHSYLPSFSSQSHQVTTLAGIEGDIWSLHRDAKAFLMARLPAPQKWQKRRVQEIETTVNEVAAKIDFKGIFDKDLTEFLLSKGM